ncbi:MAG: hypothetical protein GVY32_04605 [Gammaproteobacteria bacterium]|jgi:hypothetical protein|nr:hypothetical protein [Gammaproteobacteria bacterium]
MNQLLNDRRIAVLVVLIGSVLAWLPMQLSGMIDSGDWHVHWFRLQGFSQSLLEGEWRPYWHADANGGYGAPTFLFYPPLSYYLGSVPLLLGLAMPVAWSLVYLVTILAAALGSYRLFRLWSGAVVAATAGALWALSPPFLLKLYQIHMPASGLAVALIPWLLGAVLSPGQSAGKQISTVAAVSALMILAHPMIAVQAAIVTAILLCFVLIRGEKKGALQAIAGGAVGLLASVWYWLPLLLFRDLVQWEFLLNPAWSWEHNVLFSRPEPPYGAFHDFRTLFDGLAIAGLVVAMACYAATWRCCKDARGLATALVLSVLTCFYIMSPAGVWLAETIPPVGYLMFAWRWLGVHWLLGFGLLALSIQVCWKGIALLPGRTRALVLVVPGFTLALMFATSLAVVGAGPWAGNWGLESERISGARAERAIRDEFWPTLEMRPKSMGEGWRLDLERDPMPFVWVRTGDLRVRSLSRAQHRIVIDYEATRMSTIRLKHLNFPSWRARVGDEPVRIETEPDSGAMTLTVPPGSRRLRLDYEGWPWVSGHEG